MEVVKTRHNIIISQYLQKICLTGNVSCKKYFKSKEIEKKGGFHFLPKLINNLSLESTSIADIVGVTEAMILCLKI